MNKYIILLNDAIAELSAQKLRTFLTLLGMIFGVGAVIAMLNIGEGAERQALKLIDSMGVNNIIVESREYPSEELVEIREESLGLSMGDVNAALTTLPFVEGFSASKKIRVHDIYSDESKSQAEVIGVTLSYFEHANLKLAAGRLLNESDNARISQSAVLGYDAAAELFPDLIDEPSNIINQYVKVNHVWLSVVGVLNPPPGDKNEFQGVKIGGDRYRIVIPV